MMQQPHPLYWDEEVGMVFIPRDRQKISSHRWTSGTRWRWTINDKLATVSLPSSRRSSISEGNSFSEINVSL